MGVRCCSVCGISGILLFPHSGEVTEYRCVNHRDNHNDSDVQFDAVNNYTVKWRLRNAEGETWIEEFVCVDLADFEIIYGNNVHEILWCTFRQKGQAII